MLQSLEMFGFKSFADRTKFDFAPGITCVVGPNGSGKSNVVDAIKWILGDQSPKSLRGKEMTDVIFNGSANRKAAGFAEALLTFNNSKRFLSVDADEVQIGRRIYRSGEAEYLINRVPARLKDVRDLFLGTGAGTSAYSIIEQGRVDQLLQASTVSRRAVFEEAAGVSRFKARRLDAERKLERVAQNLLRLTDIVQEVETQLTALRTQAAKAAKYREYSQELKTLRIGLAADDYRALAAALQDVQKRRSTLDTEIELLTGESRDIQSQQQAAESQLAGAEDRLHAAERREAANRETIAGYEATVRHQTARKLELEAEHARLEKQQADLTERSEQAAGELEQADVDLETFAADFQQRRAALADSEQTIAEISRRTAQERQSLEDKRTALLDSVRNVSACHSRRMTVESQIQSRQSALTEADTRLAQIEQLLADRQRSLAERQAAVDAASLAQDALRARLQHLTAGRDELLATQARAQASLAELREQRGAAQARKRLLEDMELRQEGLGVGVKEILALAREAKGPPWSNVRGSVVDLLEVDVEQAALLEVALASRAQLIVLDDAQAFLEHVRLERCRINGRVGFVVLQEGKDRTPNMSGPASILPGLDPRSLPDLSTEPGVVCRADKLVRQEGAAPSLAARLLADTWIVASLDVALKLARKADLCRFVTQQGELLEASGTLYVGSLRGETTLVSRRSELRAVRTEVVRLDRQIADEEASLNDAALRVRTLADEYQQSQFDFDLGAHRVAELKAETASAELECQRLTQQRGDAQSDADRAGSDVSVLRSQLTEAEAELKRFETVQEALQSEISAGETQLAVDEPRLRVLHSQHATEERELARQEERLSSLRQARGRLDGERLQRDLQREESERRLQVLCDKRRQLEEEIANAAAALATLASQNDDLAADTANLQREREIARRQRGELAERDLALRQRLRDLRDQAHAIEMQVADHSRHVANLVERLRDEYQVELQDIAATSVSALHPVLESPASALPDGPGAIAEDPTAVTSSAAPQEASDGDINRLRAQIEEQINRLQRKLKQLGPVSTDSLNELDELENRYARLSGQLQDLVEARATLEEIIRRINAESRRMFVETFEEIRRNFQDLFRKLFGGGEGDTVLENPDDVLECGIDVVARPPGKELRSISLLSGGEKTMTAVALLLAMFKTKPSPFCILDEVDAALDEGNVGRYLGVIREFQQWTQFIVVSHRKPTMAGADVLYGVTMEEAGVSKRMSVRFEDVGEDGQFKAGAAAPVPVGTAA